MQLSARSSSTSPICCCRAGCVELPLLGSRGPTRAPGGEQTGPECSTTSQLGWAASPGAQNRQQTAAARAQQQFWILPALSPVELGAEPAERYRRSLAVPSTGRGGATADSSPLEGLPSGRVARQKRAGGAAVLPARAAVRPGVLHTWTRPGCLAKQWSRGCRLQERLQGAGGCNSGDRRRDRQRRAAAAATPPLGAVGARSAGCYGATGSGRQQRW